MCHIDHEEPQFARLAFDFLKKRAWAVQDLVEHDVDHFHIADWVKYHKEHAKLRAVYSKANQRRVDDVPDWQELFDKLETFPSTEAVNGAVVLCTTVEEEAEIVRACCVSDSIKNKKKWDGHRTRVTYAKSVDEWKERRGKRNR
jgi:hypothetical protein